MEGIEYSATGDGVCYLLRIPKEIRLNIYRYLLLPTPSGMISIAPGEPFEDDWSDLDVDDSINDAEANYSDSSSSDDSDDNMDEDMDGDMNGSTFISAEEALAFSAEEYEAFKKHPAILRTNKQIYQEAISMFHEEAVLVVEPGDIFCLRASQDLEFGSANQSPWKHNPLRGWKEVNGQVVYDGPEIEGGLLEPHIFARFQKVSFDANFDFEHTQNIQLWIDDDTHVVSAEDAAKFKKTVSRSTIMKDFVKLIQRSQLTNLEMTLEVEVMANSKLMMEEMRDEDDSDTDEVEEQIDALMEIARERATEMLLDSGVLEPLKTLTNVEKFEFKFGFEHRTGDEKYRPLPQHLKLIAATKAAIESSWRH